MLKKLSILVIPLVLALGAMVIFGNVSMNAVAQQNQTSTIDQTTGAGAQTADQNQISGFSSNVDQKLLNYTSAAIKALKSGNKKELTTELRTLQSALINATGKQAIILPDTTTSGSSIKSSSKSTGSSSISSTGSNSSSSKSTGSSSKSSSKSK